MGQSAEPGGGSGTWEGQLTGEVIDGRYALGGLYGAGGMAEVYQGFDTRLERTVAIKLFHGSATPEDRVRLDREVRVLTGLSCPGMVVVYDTGAFRGGRSWSCSRSGVARCAAGCVNRWRCRRSPRSVSRPRPCWPMCIGTV
ncbi:hypothetical protein [Saccharothrix sp.]|uniref:hypothetical protein n=1 Tax=Saccharothrix sp. TaxID=1873460 RepID=UPI00281212A4|nr:hypothetical protein [Saccharothrix sp.]